MVLADMLSAHALLSGLSASSLRRLQTVAQSCRLAAGETSNAAESEGMALFVTAGAIRASWLVDGRIAFQDVAAGGAFGLIDALLDRTPHPVSLLAICDCDVIVMPAATALGAIKSSAPAAMALATHLARTLEIASTGADPLQLVYRDILRAAKPMGEARWTIDPMPRHRDLAQRAGVGEEEAAAAVANLVRLGVARRRYPALDIEDREALRALSI